MKEGKVFIGIGGNLAETPEVIFHCLKLISDEIGIIINASKWVKSLALTTDGIDESEPLFINSVIEVTTEMPPTEVIKVLLSIEKRLGRKRERKWGSRLIDLDLLFYRDQIVDQENCKVPHPEITNRDFVLVPFAEIAPDFIHPIENKGINELLLIVKHRCVIS